MLKAYIPDQKYQSMSSTRIYKLRGKVQHYAWGGTDYIPKLLGIPNKEQQPFAEYWMGAHANAPSMIYQPGEEGQPLDEFISKSPESCLGKQTAQHFGRLPYLFKVLDVHDMLSIQVHPTKAEAEKGFARENAAGIPLQAPQRNYKDDNHKPEIMVALSEFWLLHGFKMPEALKGTLQTVPELNKLLDIFEQGSYKGLYRHVMEMPQEEVNEMLAPLLSRIMPFYHEGKFSRHQPEFWAARVIDSGMGNMQQIDRGIFSIYFFNIVQIKPGEGIFQAAGIPHAYLEGQNMELMANSDNVLRGGLTPKHVDVPELLKHTRFEGIVPQILKGDRMAEKAERMYASDVPDFSLSEISLATGEQVSDTSFSIEILFVLEGQVTISSKESLLNFSKGEAALIFADTAYEITGSEAAVLYKASVPR